METQFISLSKVREEFKKSGRSVKHLARNIRRSGFVLHRMKGLYGRSRYAMIKEDVEKFLSLYTSPVAEEVVIPKNKINIEEEIRHNRIKDGWISFKLTAAGMPDLINLKRKEDGSFEVLFEEIKGPGDSIKREQHRTLEEMKHSGIPVTITWID